jgi:hypothetical protein
MAGQVRRSRVRAPRHTQQATNTAAQEAILEIVENQLRDNTPPETRATLDRLVAAGHSPAAARRLIGLVVAFELNDVLQQKREFDEAAFVAALQRLPLLPI